MPFVIDWTDCPTTRTEKVAVTTPVGKWVLTCCGDVICDVDWLAGMEEASLKNAPTTGFITGLNAYWFDPASVVRIKLRVQGSPYRRQVWEVLCGIPLGETLSYAAVAKKMGSSARAVGNACRDNPYPLFIPCHRVVAASGLGGYCGQTAGQMLAIKHDLLAFESRFKA
jgi:methylated-DNA-[protein]-cysteine S-methyltransferase